MTDREKIEARLTDARKRYRLQGEGGGITAEVERLIRDAAERAWIESRADVVEAIVTDGLRVRSPELPPDFPLVLDAPKEAPK